MIILYIFALAAIGRVLSYGLLDLMNRALSKNTRALVGHVSLPVVITLILTLGSNLGPRDVNIQAVPFVLLGLLFLSFYRIHRNKSDAKEILVGQANFLPIFSGSLGAVTFSLLNWGNEKTYQFLGNGEFTNYSRLAASLNENNVGLNDFLSAHQDLRYGQDVFLASISRILAEDPINLVHLVSGYLLFTFFSALGGVISMVVRNKTAVILTVIFASTSIVPIFVFNTSWFSQAAVLPASVLVLSYLILGKNRDSSVEESIRSKEFLASSILLSAYFSYSYITYPEFTFVHLAVGLAVRLVLDLKNKRISVVSLVLLSGLFLSIAISFRAFFNSFRVFIGQLDSGGGWDIFGNPLGQPTIFLQNVLGVRYPTALPSNQPLELVAAIAAAGVIFCSIIFIRNNQSHRTELLVAAGVVLSLSVILVLRLALNGGHTYTLVKLLCDTWWIWVLIAGKALDILLSRAPQGRNRTASTLVASTLIILAISNYSQLINARSQGIRFDEKTWSEALETKSKSNIALLESSDSTAFSYLEQFSGGQFFHRLMPLTGGQCSELIQSGSRFSSPCKSDDLEIMENSFVKSIHGVTLVTRGVSASDSISLISGITVVLPSQDTKKFTSDFKISKFVKGDSIQVFNLNGEFVKKIIVGG